MPPKKANAAATKGKKPAVAKAAAASKNSTAKSAAPATNGDTHAPAKKAAPKTTAKSTKPATAKSTKAVTTTKATTSAKTEPQVNGVDPQTEASKKRKADDEELAPASPTKKVKPTAQKTTAAKKPAAKKPKVVLNHAPTERLNVYVFGQGENAELGLGVGRMVSTVKRPRLNPLLPANTVGIVHIACGGMHTAALSHDNKIYTWGVNDQGALGRDTTWDGGLKDMDESSDSELDDPGQDLNPREATPTAIDMKHFPEGTVITQLAAGDSSTWALTDEGFVYGWGTFRVSLFASAPSAMLTRSRAMKESWGSQVIFWSKGHQYSLLV